MSITNGQTILAADLDAMLDASLALVQADNAQLPLGFYLPLSWRNVVAGTAERRRKAVFVVPADCYVEAVSLVCGDVVGDVTLTITGDGGVAHWPITVTGTAAAGITKIARQLFDGTLGRGDDVAAGRAFRVWPKGSTITVVVSTTSVAAASRITATILLRSFFQRGGA